jgi:hypothetical protein
VLAAQRSLHDWCEILLRELIVVKLKVNSAGLVILCPVNLWMELANVPHGMDHKQLNATPAKQSDLITARARGTHEQWNKLAPTFVMDQEYGSLMKLKDGLQVDPKYLRNDHSRGLDVTVNAGGEGKTWRSNSRWSCGPCVHADVDFGNFARPQ